MKRLLYVIAVLCACLAPQQRGQAAFLEGDDGGAATERIVPAPRPVPPPRPADNPLVRAVRNASIDRSHTYRGLTVFLISMSRVEDDEDYTSTDEAVQQGTLSIEEKGSGSVPALRARNTGREPVLMLAGEIVLGGKQNRILQHDVLVPPRSGWLELPVLCVEHGRWSGRSTEFTNRATMSALNVRAGVNLRADQEAVWREVGSYQAALSAPNATGDLQAVQDSPEAREAVRDYRDGFRRHWRGEEVGMVVARFGRIVGADLFCNPAVFRKHRDRLLDSYAIDCWSVRRRMELDEEELIAPPAVSQRDAERFLRRALGAGVRPMPTPGWGQLADVGGNRIGGTALSHEGVLLHSALFERADIVPLSLRQPPVLRQDALRSTAPSPGPEGD